MFGFCGAMSRRSGRARLIMSPVRAAPHVPGRIYLDTGTRDGPPASAVGAEELEAGDAPSATKGLRDGVDLSYVEEKDGEHNEARGAAASPTRSGFLWGQAP